MSLENVQDKVLAECSPIDLPTVNRADEMLCDATAALPRKISPALKDRVLAFKFGGTSLLGSQRMLQAAALVREAGQTSKVIVVVSAMKGVTDHLLSITQALAAGKLTHARSEAEVIVNSHLHVLEDLTLAEEENLRVRRECQLLCRALLHEIPAQGQVAASAELSDRLASFGERFSSRLFAVALEKSGVAAVPVTSSDFVLTCENFRNAKPHLEKTRQRGRQILLPLLEEGIVPVVTGFIGATPDGRITTLGRNSSDFSGAIIAHVMDADELVIWTDVDGILNVNPAQSREPQLLHELSYDEAQAIAANGAKVLHTQVLPLAAETQMVVWVRNTFNPHARGTRIGPGLRTSKLQTGGAA